MGVVGAGRGDTLGRTGVDAGSIIGVASGIGLNVDGRMEVLVGISVDTDVGSRWVVVEVGDAEHPRIVSATVSMMP